MMEYFRVTNWHKFQHYRHRRPPWIRLHVQLLDNYEFTQLPDHCKWNLVSIFLLASKNDNCLPWNPTWIARHGMCRGKVDLELLQGHKWIEKIPQTTNSASVVLADCKQSAPDSLLRDRDRAGVPAAETEGKPAAADSLRDELKFSGVGEPKLSECCKVSGLLPVHIPLLLGRAKQEKRKRPIGWLIHHILSDFDPAQVGVSAKELCELAKAGRIQAIDGVVVNGSVKWNETTLFVNGCAIGMKTIDLAKIKMGVR